MSTIQTSDLRSLFNEQRRTIDYFFDGLDLEKVEEVLEMFLSCQGLIVTTGVGKSGIIAEKIASTLISTGTRSLHLPATNFLHGDIGALGKGDVVVCFSKSGETKELVDLVPHIRRKGGRVVAVVSQEKSQLVKLADLAILLPVLKELCPFDLAPTTSTAAQLLFGDLLAMCLMKKKEFSLDSYAENHPSGSIGKKITSTVSDLMQTDLPLCRREDRLVDVIADLSDKRCGCLLVVDTKQQLLGIFTDGDLRRAIEKEGEAVLAKEMGEVMNPCAVMTSPLDLAYTALKKMQGERYVMVAPVIESSRVIGLIRMHDIVHQGL